MMLQEYPCDDAKKYRIRYSTADSMSSQRSEAVQWSLSVALASACTQTVYHMSVYFVAMRKFRACYISHI